MYLNSLFFSSRYIGANRTGNLILGTREKHLDFEHEYRRWIPFSNTRGWYS